MTSHDMPKFRLEQYKTTTLCDDSLWEIYHDDFENWSDTIFAKADSYVQHDLRDHLRQNGVFVDAGRGKRLTVGLSKVLKEEVPHAWTPAEIKEQIENSVLNSRWNKPKIVAPPLTPPKPLVPILSKQTIAGK
ncbi:hypothetical protein GcC1_161010 [Golovinomyces cichoracearum]|uniref:Uncharacterized protein n=1 Tax=Golovinomyces cichoracearum TaxID=62708 RepID=A0A420HTS3_9PEZI|nr:hypothetical protein GcC1_161010 [Golovinomyces cichoracearum]